MFVNGVDVTDRCAFADDTPEGQFVRLYRLNDNGKKYMDKDTHEAAVEVVRSGVEIREVVQCQHVLSTCS